MKTAGKGRLVGVLVVSAIAMTIVIGRYAYLMLYLPTQSKSIPVRLPKIERGPILDRNGKILAITARLDSVSAWMPAVVDPDGSAAFLSEALGLDRDSVTQKLKSRSGFVWIKRKITPTESDKINAIKDEGKLAGINLEPEYGRNYPQRTYASHLIGYVGMDNTGLDGIEWSFQKELFPVAMGAGIEEIYGNQVFLTIDARIQYFLEKIAEQTLATHRADSVMLLAMDAPTGEILAYVSVPSFDPNNFNEYSAGALVNRPLRTAFEPGSVFKIFSISSFLQLGGMISESTFSCQGVYENQKHGFRIKDLGAHGEVDAQKILKYSCNVGAAKASETVGADEFYSILRRFGFGKPTGIPLAGETVGILRKPRTWSVRTKPTLAFGQEISVSAIQTVAAATVFANDGLLLKPILVKKIVSPEGRLIKEYSREPVGEVISPEISRSVLRMMETATETGGTAKRAAIDGVRVAGKTGTAQVTDPTTGEYYKEKYIASFLGILPADKPRVIIYVVINNPKGEQYYGSRIAAPVFKEAAEAMIPILGIPSESSRIVEHSGRVVIGEVEELVIDGHVPDLMGKPKRLLLPLFSRDDIEVIITGEGYVTRQAPEPGTPIRKGMRLILELE